MTKIGFSSAALAATFLAGFTSGAAAQDINAIFSGKTLTSDGAVMTLNTDGSVNGQILGDSPHPLNGTWRIVSLICADLTEGPKQMLGEPYCQIITEISKSSVSLDYTKPDGRNPIEYTIKE